MKIGKTNSSIGSYYHVQFSDTWDTRILDWPTDKWTRKDESKRQKKAKDFISPAIVLSKFFFSFFPTYLTQIEVKYLVWYEK